MSSRSLLAIALKFLLVFSLPSYAASVEPTDAADNLLKLHQLRLAAQKSLGDFYMYNGMEGDQRYARMIDTSLQNGQALLGSLTQMPGEGSKALLAQLDQHWNSYQSELKVLADTLKTQGYTDLQPVADLASHNQQLMGLSTELYNKIQQESGRNVSALTQLSREQSLLMQSIAVDYASRSASVGGSFISSGGENSKSIDELANEFVHVMDKLEQAPQNTAETRQSLGAVKTKWRYIEKSLKNYNEKSVPFLVNKYSDRIIEGLEVLAGQYAANNI
ncbi:MAG: hypothetical protein I8H73_07880 [Pseudomonadales bacterium]|jgi:hypothetical protein|nr:hypothetical protein [Pseudomonadales bacterium]